MFGSRRTFSEYLYEQIGRIVVRQGVSRIDTRVKVAAGVFAGLVALGGVLLAGAVARRLFGSDA